MKLAFLVTAILTSQTSFAQIKNSNYEMRHQSLIEDSIVEKCGSVRNLTQHSQTESLVRIDNGIVDVKYTTVIHGNLTVDQYVSDEYTIIIESVKSDMYDHAAAQWGAYSVNTVTCNMN